MYMVKRVNLPITLFKYNLERVIYFCFLLQRKKV
nr:MAG TPA: DNA-directed RNA polymerase subunit beta' [Bacteriophage sp.]